MSPQGKQNIRLPQNMLSFLPLGGIEDVTKNMYLYEYQGQILIVDCGLGFADESMLGVDLLLPDISYLLDVINPVKGGTRKTIAGMVLTHGHEDHIGALPYILPQLPNIPIFASPLTAAFANEKLREFNQTPVVKTVDFTGGELTIGAFKVSFIHITHSVPDSANIFIKTPLGNFYHASDFKFDLTPFDGKKTDFAKITSLSREGVMGLLSDCLGSERKGYTPSEAPLLKRFKREMLECKGKFIITTYSSNIARLNQAILAAESLGKKVCFVGRSVVKAKDIAKKLGYLHIKDTTEVALDQVQRVDPRKLVLIVAGSQGQENSAMMRIATGEHREISLSSDDCIVFSSDTIPGNEMSVSALIDSIAKRGARALYTDISDEFHVSGHGSSQDLMLMMSLVNAKYLVPLSGTYKQMQAYKGLGTSLGYRNNDIFLLENGQELLFSQTGVRMGKKITMRQIYVDQASGEEVEHYVVRDREKLAKEGIVIIMVEIEAATGTLVDQPEIVARGFSQNDTQILTQTAQKALRQIFSGKKGRVTNWIHIRKLIEESANQQISRALRRHPLILPVIIEV